MAPEPEEPSPSPDENENENENENGEQEMSDMDSNRDERDDAPKKSSNGKMTKEERAKDKLRPRRKKARRACLACQRAHLTCGDERPCQRCIKRGLQDTCHDGMRKKAKYLHDAPNEALMPGAQARYNHMAQARPSTQSTPRSSVGEAVNAMNQQGNLFSQNQSNPGFSNFGSNNSMSLQPNLLDPNAYGTFIPDAQQGNPMHNTGDLSGAVNQSQPADPYGVLFDPTDPAAFNFDLASLNFGNHYGALEFGMLGHMATGAAETPPQDNATMSHTQGGAAQPPFGTPATSGYSDSPSNTANHNNFMYGQDPMIGDWQGSGSRHGSSSNIYNGMDNRGQGPHAFLIGANNNFTSPGSSSSPQAFMTPGFESSPQGFFGNNPPDAHVLSSRQSQSQQKQKQTLSQHQQAPSMKSSAQSVLGKRTRDPASIYSSVTKPYAYTAGFHRLTDCIKRRFSPSKTLRIAKALAAIRPSFIACTRTLNQDDLLFMEKCFQRTLWEYEDFINACGTPTIVCRRTGEVAAVGKEFSILTGWTKDVLLGKEPNLNVNTGGDPTSGTTTAASRSGFNTPRLGNGAKVGESSGPQSVFLAELLDDDSVIEFYEDFSRLAFGDSRGSIMTRCKLMKYKTAEQLGLNGDDMKTESPEHMDEFKHPGRPSSSNNATKKGNRKSNDMVGHNGIEKLGDNEGRIECAYCWTVKRDVFDIPMMIVLNFLPCI